MQTIVNDLLPCNFPVLKLPFLPVPLPLELQTTAFTDSHLIIDELPATILEGKAVTLTDGKNVSVFSLPSPPTKTKTLSALVPCAPVQDTVNDLLPCSFPVLKLPLVVVPFPFVLHTVVFLDSHLIIDVSFRAIFEGEAVTTTDGNLLGS